MDYGKDNPYLALAGELWDVFFKFFREKMLWDIESTVYLLCVSLQLIVEDKLFYKQELQSRVRGLPIGQQPNGHML